MQIDWIEIALLPGVGLESVGYFPSVAKDRYRAIGGNHHHQGVAVLGGEAQCRVISGAPRSILVGYPMPVEQTGEGVEMETGELLEADAVIAAVPPAVLVGLVALGWIAPAVIDPTATIAAHDLPKGG